MAHEDEGAAGEGVGPVQRLVERDLDEESGLGKPLSRRARQTRRTLEAYLEAGHRPRWMERLSEIERGTTRVKQDLARAHRRLRTEHAGDDGAFARAWRATAEAWRFDDLNRLIREHNQWYPIERDLPIDLRTRDYVLIHGRSFRKPALDAAWVLEHFPVR